MAPIVAGPGPSLALSASTPTTPRGADGGKRRYANGTDDPTEAIGSLTDRGFTGHEHLQEVGLVHMNGRVYDPLIARFISADPHIQDPLNTQSLNRYTYVNNNPLAYTDPSGYFSIGKIFKSIFKAVTNLLQNPIALISIAVAVVAPYAVVALLPSGLGLGGWVLGAFVGGSLSGAISSGGDIKSTFMSGLISGATAAAFYYVGNFTDGHFGPNGKTLGAKLTPADYFGTSNHLLNVAGHGVVGCASSAAGGGSCQAGALSAAAGAFTGPLISGAPFAGRLAISATVGGTASAIGGGKFANGAVIAAFGQMFNAEAGRLVGGIVGGAVGFAVGAETGPGVALTIYRGFQIGSAIGDVLEDAIWGNPGSLKDHFERHGQDFGARNAIEYASMAREFFDQHVGILPTKVDASGTIRIYDAATNKFGAYGSDGSTKTFYKPNPAIHGFANNRLYWEDQKGRLLTPMGGK